MELDDSFIWYWYISLFLISIGNILTYFYLIYTKNEAYEGKDLGKYVVWMQILGGPYVLQCAWRSFWPEIYNIRVAFWDTPLNSIFLGRMLAHVGEVTWIM